MNWKPKGYQVRALDFALDNPKCQLWMDKGLGKTSVALHVMLELMDRVEVARILVVSTLRITQSTWPDEVTKWGLDMPIRDIEGGQAAQARMLDTPWVGIETITFEKLRWLFRQYVPSRYSHGRALPWHMIVFDESSKMKDPSTERFKAIERYVHALPQRIMHLTGSPAPAGLRGLWAPAYLLDAGQMLGNDYDSYVGRWFATNPYNRKVEPREHAFEQITDRVAPATMALRAADYLTMPPLIIDNAVVQLPASMRALYTKMEEEMFVMLGEDGMVEAANGGVLTSKCRQIANGALYLHQDNKEWKVLHNAKLDAVAEVVEEAEGGNVIIAYQFRSDLERLRKRWPKAGYLMQGGTKATKAANVKVLRDWNKGLYEQLLVHPASAGHGLNLQEGGCHMVLFGCPWSLDQYEQVIDRIAGGLRRTRPTFVHRILCADTVDFDIVEALASHTTVQEALKLRMARPDHAHLALEDTTAVNNVRPLERLAEHGETT